MSSQGSSTSVQVKRLQQRWFINIDDYITVLTWNPDGSNVLVGAANGQAMLLEGQNGDIIRQWEAHPMGVLSGGWSKDGQYVATGGQDGKARIYDKAGEPLVECPAGGSWVEHLLWSPHQDLFATAAGKALRVWNPQGQLIHEFEPHENTIAGLGWHPVLTDQLATTSYNGLRRFKLGEPRPIRKFQWKGSSLKLFWSPDGKHIASATQDSTVHVWDSKNGQDVQMPGYPVKPTVQAWDRNSRLLATGGNQDITIWDFSGKGPAGSEPLVLSAHIELIMALAFQHQGELLASGCQEGKVFLWHPRMIEVPVEIASHETEITQLAWSPDDSVLAVGDASGKVCVWQSRTNT